MVPNNLLLGTCCLLVTNNLLLTLGSPCGSTKCVKQKEPPGRTRRVAVCSATAISSRSRYMASAPKETTWSKDRSAAPGGRSPDAISDSVKAFARCEKCAAATLSAAALVSHPPISTGRHWESTLSAAPTPQPSSKTDEPRLIGGLICQEALSTISEN